LIGIWKRLVATQPHDRERSAGGVELRRVLGVPGLIGVGLGTMLGGIFATIGVGMHAAGPGVLASFALSGLACVFVALCYAELAAMVPVAGSAYTYAYATLGEFVAWIIGWDLILEYGISVAPTAAAWSGYVQSFLGNFGITLPAWARIAHVAASGFTFDPATMHVTIGRIDIVHSQIDVLAITIILAITSLLAIGIKESTSMNTIFVGIQVVAIGVFLVALFGVAGGSAYFVPPFPTGASGVVAGAGLVFFAYIGFDTVTVASEEARNPARDVPRAVIGSLLIGCILYLGIAYVTVGLVPWKTIDPNAGMADAVTHAGNARWLAAMVFAGAFAGTTTVMLTSLLGQVRIFYVMARDRMLPPFVARINPRTCTPVFSTITTGVLVAVLAGVIPIEALLALVNVGTLSAFTIVCVGVLVLRLRKPAAVRPFRAPLVFVTAPLGALLCIFIMTGLGTATWIRFIVWFAVGVAIYAAYGYRHSLLREA
jgi:APA family basic amino acid/polyamine antiporter